MKLSYKIIIFSAFATLLFNVKSSAQERVNEKILDFDTIAVKKVDTLTLWSQDGLGQWEGKKFTDIKVWRVAMMTRKKSKYIVFLEERTDTRYKYPIIKEDPYYVKQTHFIAINVTYFNNMLNSIKKKNGNEHICAGTAFGTIDGTLDEDSGNSFRHVLASVVLDKIAVSTIFDEAHDGFRINTQTLNGKDIARFWGPRPIVPSERPLKTLYYELSYEQLMSALTL